jgi:hypothetical protein
MFPFGIEVNLFTFCMYIVCVSSCCVEMHTFAFRHFFAISKEKLVIKNLIFYNIWNQNPKHPSAT